MLDPGANEDVRSEHGGAGDGVCASGQATRTLRAALGACARAPPAAQWRPEIAWHRLALVAVG